MMLRNLFLGILALLALLFFASELILPNVIGSMLEEELKAYFPEGENLQVEVKSRPSLRMLMRELDMIVVSGSNITVEDITCHEFTAVLEDVAVNRSEGAGWYLEQGDMTALRLYISQESLNDYLNGYLDLEYPMDVILEPGRARLHGPVDVLNQNLKITLEGTFKVEDQVRVLFEPQRLVVDDIQIPAFLMGNIMDDMEFSLDLSGLPFPFKMDEIMVGEGYLVLMKN